MVLLITRDYEPYSIHCFEFCVIRQYRCGMRGWITERMTWAEFADKCIDGGKP